MAISRSPNDKSSHEREELMTESGPSGTTDRSSERERNVDADGAERQSSEQDADARYIEREDRENEKKGEER